MTTTYPNMARHSSTSHISFSLCTPFLISHPALLIFNYHSVKTAMINILSNYNAEYNRRMDEDDKALAAILALAILGAPIHIHSIQTYLTQGLGWPPMGFSAWVLLRNVGNNRVFITTMGIDVQTFELLLLQFVNLWDMQTIN